MILLYSEEIGAGRGEGKEEELGEVVVVEAFHHLRYETGLVHD